MPAAAEFKRLNNTQLNRVVAMVQRQLKQAQKQEEQREKEQQKAIKQAVKAATKAAGTKLAVPSAAGPAIKKQKKTDNPAAKASSSKAKSSPKPAAKAPAKAPARAPAKTPAKTPAKAPAKATPASKKAAEKAAAPKRSAKKEEKEEVRRVEKIVGVRPTKTGATEFLIKWTGLNYRENTWEPEDNILDDSLIDEYMKSKIVKMAPASGKYAVGAQVDVLGEADGFEYSWAPATVQAVSKAGQKYQVEYMDFMDGKKKLTEKDIEASRLRPLQPKTAPKKWKPVVGELIEVLEDDCWWEAKVLGLEAKKETVKVVLRVSDEEGTYPLTAARPSCWWNAKK